MARPRSFDPDETLAQLKDLFWAKGYDSTSMSDIEEKTSLNKQSLYRHWGDKRAMYLAALASYAQDEIKAGAKLLGSDAPLTEKLEAIFQGAAQTADPRGCFMCNASMDQAQFCDDTKDIVQTMTRTLLKHFKKAFGPGREKEAAAMLATYQGLRVMAAAGMPRNVLMQVAKGALEQGCSPAR